MSVLDALRAGIKAADKITKPLQATVTLARVVIASDGYQTRSYPTSVDLKAVVDWKKRSEHTSTGVSIVMTPTIQFLDVAALVTATGGVGLSVEDRITLSDGSVRQITALAGFMDAGTGRPVATTAMF